MLDTFYRESCCKGYRIDDVSNMKSGLSREAIRNYAGDLCAFCLAANKHRDDPV
jgi:hypothetical protein